MIFLNFTSFFQIVYTVVNTGARYLSSASEFSEELRGESRTIDRSTVILEAFINFYINEKFFRSEAACMPETDLYWYRRS